MEQQQLNNSQDNLPMRYRFEVIYAQNLEDTTTHRKLFSNLIRWNFSDQKSIRVPYGQLMFLETPENSWEAIQLGRDISLMVQSLLKNDSMDFLERFELNNYSAWIPQDNNGVNSYYLIRLIDTFAPIRKLDGNYAVISDDTEEKNIFEVKFSANDFTYNENYYPNILKLFHGNQNNGIINLIKNFFQRRKFTNRFIGGKKNINMIQPFHNLVTAETHNRYAYGH